MRTFTKSDTARPYAISVEAKGLAWLAEAMPDGGTPVVKVVDEHETFMDLVHVPNGRPTRQAAYEFGQTLAVTHAAGAPCFGCPPAGWEGNGVMGKMDLILRTPEEQTAETWGEFFATDRIGACLSPALHNGSIDNRDIRILEEVMEHLRDGDWDVPQPSLVKGDVARIHGDLWSGNIMWPNRNDIPWAEPLPSTINADVVAVLIDPATQGGHAETDLAFLEVFGQSYLPEIYAGYNNVSTLTDGWEQRQKVHQLYLLAVHAAIFGGSYGPETVMLAKQCLAQV